MLIETFALSFLKASMTCAVLAGLIWAMLALAARAWPLLNAHRSVWLLPQLALCGAFVLALLPQAEIYSVLPALEIERSAVLADAAPFAMPAGDDGEADTDAENTAWLDQLALAWLALYGAGLAWSTVRAFRAQRSLAVLSANACHLDAAALGAHEGFKGVRLPPGLRVLETEAAISPMLAGLLQPCLLLPRHLRSFTPEQQQMIVAHELTHLRRRDPLMLHASLLLQTLFWFNPVFRVLGRRLNWALELGCDRQVLDGRAPRQRQQYAAALLAQLKVQQACVGAALPFGYPNGSAMRARIGLIREAGMQRLGAFGKGALAVLLGASILLQPALAWRAPQGQGAPEALATSASVAQQSWRLPLEHARVTSFYGAARRNMQEGHHGIDFAAKSGTPILATGDGVVVASTDLFDGGAKYGIIVMIEHADGLRSFYAHMSKRSVWVGDKVKAGQQIGLTGASGKVTGPHLHLEAFDNERRIDPQSLLQGLESNATASALRARPVKGLL